jgi:hypothetical protein
VIEVVIGIVLLASPATVIEALIGPPSGDTTSVVARVLGGALLALGLWAQSRVGRRTAR